MADPAATRLFAGTWSTKDGGIGGVYRRTVGGDGWERLGPGSGLPDTNVQVVSIDPNDRDVIYAGTADGPTAAPTAAQAGNGSAFRTATSRSGRSPAIPPTGARCSPAPRRSRSTGATTAATTGAACPTRRCPTA